MGTSWPKKKRLIGTRIARLDGPDKSTGRAKYSYDVNRPGMLHGLILRCPHAHAKIKAIDLSDAKKMPGVKAVGVFGVLVAATVAQVNADEGTVVVTINRGGEQIKRTLKLGP